MQACQNGAAKMDTYKCWAQLSIYRVLLAKYRRETYESHVHIDVVEGG